MCMRSILPIILLALLPPAEAVESSCDERRPGHVFQALEELDAAGEKRLHAALQQLSKQEGWSQNDWEKYTLALSDSPAVTAMEERRNSLVAEIFTVLRRPPYDCAALDRIEAEILELEQRQWDEAIRRVEKHLGRTGSTRKFL